MRWIDAFDRGAACRTSSERRGVPRPVVCRVDPRSPAILPSSAANRHGLVMLPRVSRAAALIVYNAGELRAGNAAHDLEHLRHPTRRAGRAALRAMNDDVRALAALL